MQDYRARSYSVNCTVEDQVYTLYTCPQNCRSNMVLLYIANANGNTTVSVKWERADGSDAHILGGKNTTNGEFVQWYGSYIVLEPGDYITVQATGNASPIIDAFCTVEEYYLPNRSV